MTLFRTHGRVPSQSALGSREHITTEIGAPCHIWPRRPEDIARGILWAGGDPDMIG